MISQFSCPPYHNNKELSEIVLVFGTVFDPKDGNAISFVYPETPSLRSIDGIEFITLPPGSHITEYDYHLFRYSDLYGVSVFTNIADPQVSMPFSFHFYILF